MKKKPWNKYEAAILLDAVVKVHHGEIDRGEAVSNVSAKLRQMAINSGEEIDDIYRNIAGITFQMYSMESAYYGHTLVKPASQLFKDVVSIMNYHNQEYEILLEEALQMFYMGDYRIEYQNWLIEDGLGEASARNYGNWLNKITVYANEKGYCDKTVYEMEECELENLYEKLSSVVELQRHYGGWLTSLKKYIAYRKNTDAISGAVPNDRPTCQQTIEQAISNVNDEAIKEEYPALYMKLKSIAEVYDDVNGFTTKWIYDMLRMGINYDEFRSILDTLSWVTKVAEDVYSFSKFAEAYEPADNFDKESFIKILNMRYSNGMRFDSIDFENFREAYSDCVGEDIEFSDADLEKCLRKCGILYHGRLFPAEGIISSKANEKLMKYISDSFEEGKQVLYYKAIYSDLSEIFEYCFNLTDAMMLRPYLEYVCEQGEYFFSNDYISKVKYVKIDHSKEIEDYLLSEGRPLSYGEIYNGLSHISKNVIYDEIKINRNIILNEKEHYYHVGIFECSPEEEQKLSDLIQKDIDENGYCIWSQVFERLPQVMPIFIENNIYLSSVGLRNAVSRKLGEKFNFESDVISSIGHNLNMSEVYELYCLHHAPFSDKDIYELSREVSKGVIYFEALSKLVIRVSKNLFVPRADVHFDVEAVDNALSTYLDKGYMLIKDVDSFLVFPNVGYEWNEYLLESYLLYYSEKYTLSNSSRSLNNVAGALVRKWSGYDDFVHVCADALANSDILLTKDKSLDYLAELNLLTRKSYNKIDDAITIAKNIRNKRG